jgi:hypothetical protein
VCFFKATFDVIFFFDNLHDYLVYRTKRIATGEKASLDIRIRPSNVLSIDFQEASHSTENSFFFQLIDGSGTKRNAKLFCDNYPKFDYVLDGKQKREKKSRLKAYIRLLNPLMIHGSSSIERRA